MVYSYERYKFKYAMTGGNEIFKLMIVSIACLKTFYNIYFINTLTQ